MEKEEKLSYSELSDRLYKLEKEVADFVNAYKTGSSKISEFDKGFGQEKINIETESLELPNETEFRDVDDLIYSLNQPNQE
jgi:hypothetical protein